MTVLFRVFLPGDPVAKGRPRFRNTGKFVQTYTPKKTRDYEAKIKRMVSEQISEPFTGALELRAIFYMPIPQSWSKRKKAEALGSYHTSKPDLDNLAKVCDGFNEVLWLDDSQIAKTQFVKKYGETPGIALELRRL